MRVSRELEKLLFIVNKERVMRGIKPLSASQFTQKVATRFINDKRLIHEQFIQIP